jgi:protocatechuate 3,4-dioxygenase beta subunit
MEERERLHEVTARIVRGLLEAMDDLRITDQELRAAIGYLNEVGANDEFGLLSDVTEISVRADALTHGREDGATATNVEGPFYKPGAPMLSPPFRLAAGDEPGDPLLVSGRVTDATTGQGVREAMLDAWQANAAGLYDNNDPSLGDFHLRGRMLTEDAGSYEFRTVVPPPYEIPKDGPVGRLLRALGRHAFRPAHLHLKASADGYAPLTTMVYFRGDPWLGSDTIGAVKDSLVVELERLDSSSEAGEPDRPFFTCRFDVKLQRV